MNKTELKKHEVAVTNAAKNLVNATQTLAEAVKSAADAGVDAATIRKWLRPIVNSANLSKTLIAVFGESARLRARRSDAGKSKSEDAGEILSIELSLAFAPEKNEKGEPQPMTAESVAKRIVRHCKGNAKKAATFIGHVKTAVEKIIAAAAE